MSDDRRAAVDEAVRRMAVEAAPELLEQVLEESRREAAEILKEHLRAALVEEMGRLMSGSASPVAKPVESPTVCPVESPSVSPVVPILRAEAPARSGWYVYGITRADQVSGLDIRSGVDGAPVELVAAGDLAAVVSPLSDTRGWDVDDSGGAALEALAPRARAHEAVLEQVMDRGAVLPLRFGVLYPDVDRLHQLLRDRAGAFRQTLQALEGHGEWGLTVTGAVADARAGNSLEGEGAGPSDGRDYLSRRRAERQQAEARADRVAQVASEIHRRLQELSGAAVVHRGPARRADAVLRASYLVPEESTEAFKQVCEQLLTDAPAELDLSGELTGPWPPYHFCDLSLDEVPA